MSWKLSPPKQQPVSPTLNVYVLSGYEFHPKSFVKALSISPKFTIATSALGKFIDLVSQQEEQPALD